MKAKVIWKFNGAAKLQLQDGRVLKLSPQDVNKINCAMQWGDEGVVYQNENGTLKFLPDSIDIWTLPVHTPPPIQTPPLITG